MALKITIEKVDDGITPIAGHIPRIFGAQGDQLPIEVVVREDNTTGVTILTLKHFLNIVLKGKLSSAVALAAAGDTVVGSIQKSHIEHVDPII